MSQHKIAPHALDFSSARLTPRTVTPRTVTPRTVTPRTVNSSSEIAEPISEYLTTRENRRQQQRPKFLKFTATRQNAQKN
jgi:hypothetical protein